MNRTWWFLLIIDLSYLPVQYHAGYQEQMSHWPELPVNIIIKWLKDHSPSLVVADFGCGKVYFNVLCTFLQIKLQSTFSFIISCDHSLICRFLSSVDVFFFDFQVMHALQKMWRTKSSPLILSHMTLQLLLVICQTYVLSICIVYSVYYHNCAMCFIATEIFFLDHPKFCSRRSDCSKISLKWECMHCSYNKLWK